MPFALVVGVAGFSFGALGVGVAAVALALRAPVLLAALVTALARLFLG